MIFSLRMPLVYIVAWLRAEQGRYSTYLCERDELFWFRICRNISYKYKSRCRQPCFRLIKKDFDFFRFIFSQDISSRLVFVKWKFHRRRAFVKNFIAWSRFDEKGETFCVLFIFFFPNESLVIRDRYRWELRLCTSNDLLYRNSKLHERIFLGNIIRRY